MKIGVLGDNENVMGYKTLGFEVACCDTKEAAVCGLRKLARECAVIFVIEDTAKDIQEEIYEYQEEKTPAIILIPGSGGSLGIGMKALNLQVEKAVGSNILEGKDNG
ncbi:MAG: V-type ATP synthase subunit F [Clostridia bacterium]|nr:V-type ATP synthase subunit F [Clostridia bacterium]